MRVAPAPMIAVALVAASSHAAPTYQLDPFAQATSGFAGCPPVAPPLLTESEMRAEAHVRAERGTRCAMDGTCEPGGAYKRDAEVNERVRAAIAAEPRFAKTSIWLTTSRKWVTLEGCVRSGRERRALEGFVRRQPMVERVFDDTTIGVPKTDR
jgi:hypothetical protein